MSLKAVILAGGLGQRLRPFTLAMPKPLMPVGESALIDNQLIALGAAGVETVYIATNYMSDYLERFVGDGSRFGLRVIFSRENAPLGTAGPLSLISNQLNKPFLVINGDILTTEPIEKIAKTHHSLNCSITVGLKKILLPFNFGSVKVERGLIKKIEEKPTLPVTVVAGIYMLDPTVLRYIPKDTAFGMDQLIKCLLENKEIVGAHYLDGYWLDIGRIESLEDLMSIEKQIKSS